MPRHPNRLPFEGVLARIDVPSDKPPRIGILDGKPTTERNVHRVMLTADAAKAAIPSLWGMAVNFAPELDGHDVRRKVGVITRARIDGTALRVGGYLFAMDFPEVNAWVGRDDLGMSFDIYKAVYVEDKDERILKLVNVTFTGGAILLREKAAYRTTEFVLGEK